MKKALIFLLCLLLFGACAEPVQRARLPVSEDGTDWNNVGNGGGRAQKPDDFAPVSTISRVNFDFNAHEEVIEVQGQKLYCYLPRVEFLRDEAVGEKINSVLEKQIDGFRHKLEGLTFPENAKIWGSCFLSPSIVGNYVSYYSEEYLSVYALDENGEEIYDPDLNIYNRAGLTFDLRTGERLCIEDLFFEGADFNKIIGASIASQMSEELKRPFSGLPENYSNFRISYDGSIELFFPKDNPYFLYAPSLKIPVWDIRDIFALQKPDMSLYRDDFVNGDGVLCKPEIYEARIENGDCFFGSFRENGEYRLKLVCKDEPFPELDSFNEKLYEMTKRLSQSSAAHKALAQNEDYFPETIAQVVDNIASVLVRYWYTDYENSYQTDAKAECFSFDLDTGKEIFLGDILKSENDFKEYYERVYQRAFTAPSGFSESCPVYIDIELAATFIYNNTTYYVDREFLNCKEIFR